jgi:serine/threonine-protein kinase
MRGEDRGVAARALLVGLVVAAAVVLAGGVSDARAAGWAQITLPFTGLNSPWGMTVDRSGDVFVADTDNARVMELVPGRDGKLSDGTQTTLPIAEAGSTGVAVDGSGDVFAADSSTGQVVELIPGADGKLSEGTQITLPISLNELYGVAVDRSGDVFATDDGYAEDEGEVVELIPGADGELSDGAQITLPFTGPGRAGWCGGGWVG